MIGKAKKETYTVYKVAVICDSCAQANQYAIQNRESVAESTPCGNTNCTREFAKAELQVLIDEAG